MSGSAQAEITVHVVDRVVLRPGRAKEFVDAYLAQYVPRARIRGLTLDRLLVSPPVWLDDEPVTLTALWSAAGPAGWWKAAVDVRYDPESAGWWERHAGLVVERERSSAADPRDVALLCGEDSSVGEAVRGGGRDV